jgi:DNA processing protein
MKSNSIRPGDNNYLQVLDSIAKPPEILHYIGTLPADRQPTVAIVGTRKPSRYGQEVTHRLAYDLAQQGIIVVSGLALGVDALAHTAALEAGGTTIAVLGNGLPAIHPRTNTQLAHRIVDSGGAIVSEYSDGTVAYPGNFLERNRLVSGLADAIIITEAAARSGTLNTAAHALEQGKDVFVVPGNITSPQSAGCNALLKQGANVVTDYKDVVAVIRSEINRNQTSLPLGRTELENTIIRLIGSGLRDGEELLKASGAEATEFATTLTMMELNGIIRPLGANQWTLR